MKRRRSCGSSAEVVEEVRGAGVGVRLEEADDAPVWEAFASGTEDCFDLGRVVCVVVHDADAGGVADVLEAAADSMELPDSVGDIRFWEVKKRGHGDGPERVCHVVRARKLRLYGPPQLFSVSYHKR